MNIGIDGHFIGHRFGGNESYFQNIITSLSCIKREKDRLFVFTYLNKANKLLTNRNLSLNTLKYKSVIIQRGFEIPQFCILNNIDVLHVPFNVMPSFGYKKIISIHDLSFLEEINSFSVTDRLRMKYLTFLSAKVADHILTISEYSKREILKKYKIPENKVTVAGHAVNPEKFLPYKEKEKEAARKKRNLPEKYILFVGTLQPRKNLLTLLKACQIIWNEKKESFKLVLAGRKGWLYKDFLKLINEKQLEDKVIHLGSVDEKHLLDLYNCAEIFVFPSLFEGFGIPILEAMHCGCPVISSNTTSMPEVYGNAAVTFSPLDYNDLAEKIIYLFRNKEIKEEKISLGFNNVKRFYWEKTARIIYGVYHS